MNDETLPYGYKKCKGCSQVKPFDDFGKEARGKFGLKAKCKTCISVKNKVYSDGPGAEVKNQHNKKYQSEHKEELAEKMRIARAKKKYGDRYDAYLADLEMMKTLK